jgi:energy-coupling factor transport system ATP-binding protein
MHLVDRVLALTNEGTVLADGPPQVVFDTQAEVLLEHGVWMPQTALLAHKLRHQGLDLTPFPLTLLQAERAMLAAGARFSPDGHHPATRTEDDRPLAVEVRDLSFSYGKTVVLEEVNLCIPQGDFLALVGANGAGKTTLAQHLVDVLHPPRGSVLLNGNDVTTLSARELIQHVGYVFQNPEHQFITDSVAHEVGFGLRLMGWPEDEINTRVEELLAQFGLLALARANPFTLSHGEKRRLSVATMLAVGQDTLILDEPTFGQDQRNAQALMQVLRDLHAAGRTVMMITHDMNLVAEYAQHVAVVVEGRLVFQGVPADVFARPDLLAQARLTQPPLAELSARMATHDPHWPRLHTVRQYLEARRKE